MTDLGLDYAVPMANDIWLLVCNNAFDVIEQFDCPGQDLEQPPGLVKWQLHP